MLWWTLQQLRSSKVQARLEAIRKLGTARERKAVPALLEALQDEDGEVRLAVIDALALIAHPASAEPLANAISALSLRVSQAHKPAVSEYEHLAKTLAAVGKPSVFPAVNLLRSEDKETRRWAAVVLGQLKDPEAVEALAARLDDNRSEVRKCAAEALGQIADRRGAPYLIKSLTHRDPDTRRASAEALGRIAADEAGDPLARATADPTEAVQIAAVNALGRIPGLRSAAALRAAAETGRKALRDAALASLGKMAYAPESPIDRAAFFVLAGKFEDAMREGAVAETALVGALSSREAVRRRDAAHALGRLKLPGSVQPLLKLLRDHHPEVQRASADALAAIGDSTVVEGLLELLECPDPSAQRESARALGIIADPRAAGPLADLIRGNRRTTADYPEPLEAARIAANSLLSILNNSAGAIPRETLARIAEVPDCVVLTVSNDQVGRDVQGLDCSAIRQLAQAMFSASD